MSDNELAAGLHQLLSVLSRESDQRLLEQLGLGLSQYKILTALHTSSKPQQRLIALELGQTEASISRQIKILENKGMLTVSKNPDNLREHHIALTGHGLRLIEAAERVLGHYHEAVFTALGKKQRAALEEALALLHP